MIRHWRLE